MASRESCARGGAEGKLRARRRPLSLGTLEDRCSLAWQRNMLVRGYATPPPAFATSSRLVHVELPFHGAMETPFGASTAPGPFTRGRGSLRLGMDGRLGP